MTTWRKRIGSAGPVIALVVVATTFVVLQYGFAPTEAPLPPPVAEQSPQPPEPPPAPVELEKVTGAASWSYYHGDSTLTGFVDLTLPDALTVRWRYLAEGRFEQPVVANEQGMYACTTDGLVVALDFDGNPRWTATVGDGERVAAPIACGIGMVFVPCMSGRLYALNAADGAEQWTYEVDGELLGSVQIFDPEGDPATAGVYVVNRVDGEVFYLAAETGELHWRMGEVSRFDGSPALNDDALVMGSCAVAIHVYPAGKDAARLDVSLGGDCQIASGPAITGGLAYSGSRCGRLVCMNVRTGQVLWTNESCPDEIFTTPAVGDDVLVFGGEDDGLYALERATGELRWRIDVGDTPGSPVLVGERVLVNARGALHMLQVDTGEEVWRFAVSDAIASPSVIQGMVIVAGDDGSVVAFGP